jgi:Ca2+-binding RTX toxin-like protein
MNGADTIRSGRGADTLNPDNGKDIVFGGPSNDYVVYGNDRKRDVINCGPGHDYVDHWGHIEKRLDKFVSCETVTPGL